MESHKRKAFNTCTTLHLRQCLEPQCNEFYSFIHMRS